jgi:hypothetical protein
MRFLHRIRVQRAIALAGLLLLAGCGRSLLVSAPVANDAPGTLAAAVQAPQPPSLLGGALPIIDKILSWVPVVQTLVRKDQVATVSGHRWSLAFDKGSLTDDTVITIDDYDANVLDVQFGPHGTKFPVPVTLRIPARCSSTAASRCSTGSTTARTRGKRSPAASTGRTDNSSSSCRTSPVTWSAARRAGSTIPSTRTNSAASIDQVVAPSPAGGP